ncbi:MAG: DUF6305 family protein [bacterium]|jgi:hypothetical protein|nr:DUF6305 family protein [bacterium]
MRLLIIALMCWMLGAPIAAPAAPPPFREPVLITCAGQSSDLLLARQLFTKAGVSQARASSTLTADSLAGAQSLVLVVGGSSKGLGQAKNATDVELARIKGLIARARAAKLPILCLHVGREARRGPLSDPFITPVVPQSTQVLVLAGGNKDQFFTKLTAPAKVPLVEAADYRELTSRIAEAYGRPAPK